MKRLLIALCGALMLAASAAQATSMTVSTLFAGCTQPKKVTIAPGGGVWFPCIGVLAVLYYGPGVYGAPLPPAIAIDSIPLPAGVAANMLAFDASNYLWFTDFLGNRIGKANLTTKVVTTYALPAGGDRPEGIVFASDGNIYVSTFGNGVVYRVSASGAMTPVASLPAGHHIRGLAAGAGAQLVFGDFDDCKIYEYSPIFDVTVSIPAPCQKIYDVTIGPDALVWYAGGTKIGKLTASGAVPYDPAPGTIAVSIAAAPDGTLWYGGDTGIITGHTKVGQITTAGLAFDAPVPGGGSLSTAAYIAVRQSDGTPFFTLPGDNKYGMVLPAVATSGTATVVEYYWATRDHYFITANPAEIAALDASPPGGWVRTGVTARVWNATDEPLPNASPVCRFYGRPEAGLDSHFYSASPAECQAVIDRFPAAWQFESRNVFMVILPNPTSGACPVGTVPVYRLFNNRIDVNHRYTGLLTTRATMIAAGWTPEGYGPLGVAMCSPAQ
ncbi:MAG: hypothetical protein ABI886_00740 [Betaproteobacteria bacterium]